MYTALEGLCMLYERKGESLSGICCILREERNLGLNVTK